MEDSIIIYTMSNCKYCSLVKQLMDRAGFAYIEMKLDRDVTREQIKETLSKDSITFPQVIFRGEHLGGLVETAKHFQKEGFV